MIGWTLEREKKNRFFCDFQIHIQKSHGCNEHLNKSKWNIKSNSSFQFLTWSLVSIFIVTTVKLNAYTYYVNTIHYLQSTFFFLLLYCYLKRKKIEIIIEQLHKNSIVCLFRVLNAQFAKREKKKFNETAIKWVLYITILWSRMKNGVCSFLIRIFIAIISFQTYRIKTHSFYNLHWTLKEKSPRKVQLHFFSLAPFCFDE